MTENKNSKNNRLPFLYSSIFGYGDDILIEAFLKDLSDINAQDKKGMTPLIAACAWGGANAVEYLVKQGADVNTQDDKGNTCIMYVVETASIRVETCCDLLRYLLDNCKIDFDKKNAKGENVFDIANHSPEKIKAMLYSYFYAKVKNPVAEKVKDANVKTK